MTKETGRPAFPGYGETGMTLRDYFAAKAMAALYQSHYESQFTGKPRELEFIALMDELAGDAYCMADAMLKARGE